MVESPLIYFVREREAIRKKKEAGLPPPWTKDPILQTYRFTNVRRRDDRVTKWLLQNVLTEGQLARVGLKSFMLFTALCRFINWPPTIQAIMHERLWSKRLLLPRIGSFVDAEMGQRKKVWTGAYMVRAAPEHQMGKGMYVAAEVIGKGLKPVLQDLERLYFALPSRRGVWELLCQQKGWGSFMAGQVVDDWAMTPLLQKADDHFTFAPQGPGSVRGLNRLHGFPLKQRWPMDKWIAALMDCHWQIINKLGIEFKDMTLHDVQNSLCETDKYLRTKAGEGRPRSKYKPEIAY